VHVKIYQFACAHALPVRIKSYMAQMIDLHLNGWKGNPLSTQNVKNIYAGLGGSHMANTGRGLSSRLKVEEVVN